MTSLASPINKRMRVQDACWDKEVCACGPHSSPCPLGSPMKILFSLPFFLLFVDLLHLFSPHTTGLYLLLPTYLPTYLLRSTWYVLRLSLHNSGTAVFGSSQLNMGGGKEDDHPLVNRPSSKFLCRHRVGRCSSRSTEAWAGEKTAPCKIG